MTDRRRVRTALVLIALPVAALSAQLKIANNSLSFTVADSIQMVTFSDPYTRDPEAFAKESPNHQGFVVVTTRGRLAQNVLESSLWYFPRAAVERFLEDRAATPPHPQLLFRKTGKIVSFQANSYGSLISDVHWAKDSKSLLAIVEQNGGRRHLLQIDIASAHALDLTPHATGEIRSATTGASTTAYLELPGATATEPNASSDAEIAKTGQTLFRALFPENFPNGSDVGGEWKLHVNPTRNRSSSFAVPYPAAAALTLQPVVSADGKSVIVAMPVKDVPQSWEAYRSGSSNFHFYPISSTVDRSGKAYEWPWEYALLDTKSQRVRPLWEAPSAWISGYGNVQQAEWSPSGSQLLVTNTYLPLQQGLNSKPDTVKPCAVAVYAPLFGRTECVAMSRYPDSSDYLREAHYDLSDDRIITRWTNRGRSTVVLYERKFGTWVEVIGADNSSEKGILKLFVRQDLTVPPTLWAIKGRKEKPLWNPNPQLNDTTLAGGEVIRWKDQSGYDWKGALLIPPSPAPQGGYPLVIQTHGFYNEHEFMPDGAFTTGFAAQPLACAGIAVLQIEDRSDRHLNSPLEESELSAAGYTSAVDYLVKLGTINPARVGIIGFSRTHWYVERALETSPEYFRAATLIDGIDQSYVTDVLFSPGRTVSSREHDQANGGQPFGPSLMSWVKHAVGFNLEKLVAPVRLEAIGPTSLLGEWETYSILSQQGKAVDLLEIPHGQHILQNPQERYASQQGNVDWFRFWLQGIERTDSDVGMQYSRWKDLRTRSLH